MAPLLTQPHPLPGKRSMLTVAALMGLGIALFLIVFQPFGLHNWQAPGKAATLAGYGAITFGVVALNGVLLPSLLPGIYRQDRWTLGRDLALFGLLNFATIALANLFYTSWAFGFALSWGRAAFSLFATLSVGFLPFLVLVLYRHNRLLQHNMRLAAAMNHALPMLDATQPTAQSNHSSRPDADTITLQPDSGTAALTFSPADLVCAESADNYVRVTIAHGDTAKTTLVRQTLKHLEELVATRHSRVVRCHRSFLVNMDHVVRADGNAQGLKLHMHHSCEPVPVSRSYVPAIRSLLATPK